MPRLCTKVAAFHHELFRTTNSASSRRIWLSDWVDSTGRTETEDNAGKERIEEINFKAERELWASAILLSWQIFERKMRECCQMSVRINFLRGDRYCQSLLLYKNFAIPRLSILDEPSSRFAITSARRGIWSQIGDIFLFQLVELATDEYSFCKLNARTLLSNSRKYTRLDSVVNELVLK